MNLNRHFFKNIPYASTLVFLALIISCGKEPSSGSDTKNSNKAISGFSVKKSDGTFFEADEISVNIIGDSVKIVLPATADATNLVPDIQIDGAVISPASGVAQNFKTPVAYTVTASDGTIKKYFVVVHPDKLKNIIFTAAGLDLFAISSGKGKLIWKFSAGQQFAGVVYGNGVLYAGNQNGNIYAIDVASGTLKWQDGAAAISTAPVLYNNMVCFANDRSVNALDIANKALRWTFTAGGHIDSNPVIADNVMYFGSYDGYLYALNPVDGTLKWKYNTTDAIINSKAVVSNGVVYIGSRSGFLYAINTTDGTLKWKIAPDANTMENAQPIIKSGVIYFGGGYHLESDFTHNVPGTFYAVKESDGSMVWKTLEHLGFFAAPAEANGKLYVTADDGNLYALDAVSGTILWKKLISSFSTTPSVSENVIFSGSDGAGYYYALDPNTGQEKWKFKLPVEHTFTYTKAVVIDSNGN